MEMRQEVPGPELQAIGCGDPELYVALAISDGDFMLYCSPSVFSAFVSLVMMSTCHSAQQ